jgi:TDG/mug DNA glycosylase family protein
MICKGFNHVARRDAQILILGTLPGAESLGQRQYYAKKANRFWWIMGELVGASPSLPYQRRLELLKAKGIALWDVCASAERSGSLDSKINLRTVVANDFDKFLRDHEQVKLICFNGRKARSLYCRKALLTCDVLAIRHEVLPSTSPAYAAMSCEVKLAHWRGILSEYITK